MTTALIDRIRSAEASDSSQAAANYVALVADAAEQRDIEPDHAKDVLAKNNKTVDDLVADIADYRGRARLVAQLADVDRVEDEIDNLHDQLATLQAERESLVAPIEERIAAVESKLHPLHAKARAARSAEQKLVETAPEFIKDAKVATMRRLAELEREAEKRLQPVQGEAVFVDGEWRPFVVPGMNISREQQDRFDDFMRRRAEHDAQRELLRPEIERLKARVAALTHLAIEKTWPTPADLAAIDAEAE